MDSNLLQFQVFIHLNDNIDRSSLVNGGFDICKDWSITYMNVYVKSKLISNVNCKLGQSETAN